MNTRRESTSLDSNTSRQEHYCKWKNLNKSLSDNKPNETESKVNNKEKEKKTFEDYFPVDTVIKFRNINNLDYEPILRA